jgi:hypothetical protein
MPAETLPTGNALVKQAQQAMDDLLSFRLVRATTWFLPRAPLWLRSVLFSLLALVVLSALSWLNLFGEPSVVFFRLSVQGAVNLLVWLVAFDVIGRDMLIILARDVAPTLPPAVTVSAARRLQEGFTLRRQTLVSVLSAGLITALAGPPVLIPTLEFKSTLAFFLFLILTMIVIAIIIPIVHFGALLTSTTHLFTEGNVPLYPLDPRRSPLIRGSTAISQRVVVLLAVLGAFSILMTLLFAPGSKLLLLAATVLGAVSIAGLVGMLFVLQQRDLSRIVAERRARTLTELQAELSGLYDNRDSLSAAERERFDYLLALHDRVTKTSDKAFNFGGALRFASPLVLPLLSLLLSNLSLPFLNEGVGSVLQEILSQLQ